MNSHPVQIRRRWLLAAWLISALTGCGDQRIEVLTLDGGLEKAARLCGTCDDEPACSPENCVELPAPRRLAAGWRHTCRITMDDQLYCWGENESGQLGTGDVASRSTPMRVGTSADWMSVAAGSNHTCGVRAPGKLFCWGDNSQGQQAGGSTNNQGPRGRLRQVMDWEDVVDVQCGGDNCCALRAGGALYCWGANLDGSAGVGSQMSPITRPMRVGQNATFLRVLSVGGWHSCAIRRDGMLMCWGRNEDGQLGLGENQASRRSPAAVGDHWLRVAAGDQHTCAIRGDRSLYCWGGNGFVQLGMGYETLDKMLVEAKMPSVVSVAQKWAEIAAGSFHTCALTLSGQLSCWGRGSSGQLGADDPETSPFPQSIAPAMRWQTLALGTAHTCGVDLDDQLFCWGENSAGQLGIGDLQQRSFPTRVKF